MADLNALIAQGYQFQAPPDPFANYAKMQQLDQGEQTNQLNRMKMQEYQRGMEETNAMRRLDPTSATYLQDITRINPEKGFAFAKMQQEAGTARTEGNIKNTELLTKKLAMLPDAYRMADTPEAYLQLHESIHADPVIGPYLKSVGATPDKGRAAIQQAIETGTFDKLRLGSMQSVSQLLDSMKPQVVGASSSVYDPQTKAFTQAPSAPAAAAAPPAMVAEYTFAKTPDGGNFRGSYQDFVTARAAAGRAPAAPRPEQPPVAVVDPATGKQVYVTREQSFGMTPATSTEGLSTKEIQKREAVLPQARQAVKTVGNTMSVIDETVDRLLANPDGLNGITGTIYGRTPAFTDAANTANADLEQLRNLAFVQGLTELRAASKTGAGVGNVSNREGERFENLKASLDRRQSKTDLENALRRLKEQAAFTRQTMQEAFDETYQYKQAAPSVAPAAGGLNVVVTPDGQSHTFPTPAAAAQFKKAAGIQ